MKWVSCDTVGRDSGMSSTKAHTDTSKHKHTYLSVLVVQGLLQGGDVSPPLLLPEPH